MAGAAADLRALPTRVALELSADSARRLVAAIQEALAAVPAGTRH